MSQLEFTSKVSKVTVYTDRAMVSRSATATLSADAKSIQIVGLPMSLREDSLRIGGEGPEGMTILDFKLSDQEFKEVPEAALNTLEEERTRFQDNIAALQDEIAAIEHQKSFLKQISVGKAEQISKDLDIQRPLLDDWKAVLDFVGGEQRELDESRRNLQLKIRKIESDIRMIEAELQKYAGSRSKTRKLVTIELELEQEGEYEFEISYLIQEASWQPMYDARVDSKAKKVGIRYYGVVQQRTGEDWDGIEILLSTARPQLGGNVPNLRPWYVSPQQPIALSMPGAFGGSGNIGFADEEMAMPKAEMARSAAPKPKKMKKQRAKQVTAQVEEGQGTSVVFRTGGRGKVPGNGGPSKLLIMDGDFGNHFSYLTVPKLAEHVYLQAEITNTTDYPMLPGRISIFLEGNFVGHSRLKELITPAEKFELELGVDESIKVTHKLQKQKGDEKGIFSRSKVQEYSYLITLESQRDTEEEIVIRDQLPVSSDEKIKVELTEIVPDESAEKDEDKLPNGTLEWKVNLGARATEKLTLNFTVAYPKDMDVTGL